MPAQADGRGTVSVSLTSRGNGPPRTINFPNRPSTQDQTSIQLNDFESVCRRCAGGTSSAAITKSGPITEGAKRQSTDEYGYEGFRPTGVSRHTDGPGGPAGLARMFESAAHPSDLQPGLLQVEFAHDLVHHLVRQVAVAAHLQ